MRRTIWRGFGGENVPPQADGGGGLTFDFTALGSVPPADPSASNSSLGDLALTPGGNTADLVAAAAAREAGRINVDPLTALQSRVSATIPTDMRLPLVLAGAGLLALLLTSGGGRR